MCSPAPTGGGPWPAWKIDAITHTFNYPTYFQLDRDIVHPATYELAAKYGQPLAPTTVGEVTHDLGDVARFRVSRQVKTEPLLDQLINFGAPGNPHLRRVLWSQLYAVMPTSTAGSDSNS